MFDFFFYNKHAENQKKRMKNVLINFEKFNLLILLYQKYIHQDQDQHDVNW